MRFYPANALPPGVDSKDIELTAENGFRIIRGKRRGAKEGAERNENRGEFPSGRFERGVDLPKSTAAEKHKACQAKVGIIDNEGGWIGEIELSNR